MNGEGSASNRKLPIIWKSLLVFDLLLGLLLWFGGFTDYSWAGTVADIAYPFVVVVSGLFSLVAVVKVSGWGRRLLALLSCVPSLFGGCASIILAAILFLPPFTLGTVFMIDEITGEKLIQRAVSADGWRVAEVYFRPVGAYSGGNGRVYIRVKHRLFPLVERDVYYVEVSHADESTSDYLHWKDSDTLYIYEEQREVNVEGIRPRLPTVVSVPVSMIGLFASLLEEERADYELAAPAREMPTPEHITDETYSYWEEADTAIWNFNVPSFDPDQLAEWYSDALSDPPWLVVQARRQVTESGSDHIIHHIQARRVDSDGQKRDYCIEILGRDGAASIHVNIFTPDCTPCEYWFEQP
jgi:hypothetical protein